MYSKEGEDAILNWVRTLTSGDEPNINDLGDLANGKIMAQILNRLVIGELNKLDISSSENVPDKKYFH